MNENKHPLGLSQRVLDMARQAEADIRGQFAHIDAVAEYNSQKVLAIEMFAGAQALWLRDEDKLSPATRAVYDRIRTVIPPIEEDVVMHPLMVRAEELVKEHALSQAAEAVCGELK